MSYVEIRYYKNYAMEVREFGDTGWAIHVYAPRQEHRSKKMAIVTTTDAAGLDRLASEAQAKIDLDLQAG
jgi:hypothetical protein